MTTRRVAGLPRILIVDDERQNRALLAVMLSLEGFVLMEACSGEEALATVAQSPPDLILLDVLMPGMNGYQVAAKLKANLATKSIPVIMVTAMDDHDAKMFGLSAGAEDFLAKPLDRAELCMRVRNLLRLKGASDAALAQRDDSMGMVSHELRNMLSSIVLRTSLLAKEASDSVEGRRVVQEVDGIQKQTSRMNRLIGDLVDVVSMDAGKLALKPTHCDGSALLTEVLDACGPSALGKGVALRSQAVDGLEAKVDRERVLQVLTNLVTNALKFTPVGGSVTVRAERIGESLRLAVSDTGIGIASHLLEAVFDRFWQVGCDDRRGIGLGLYISRCIVESHGGRIWAESELGEGSTFFVSIPGVVTVQPCGESASQPLRADLGGRLRELAQRGEGRVLLVDDDEAICTTLAKYLIRRGFSVAWCMSATEAVAIVSAQDFDVIVTDLNMPQMDGLALCKHVVGIRPDVPVIVTSAFGPAETQSAALSSGAHDFLNKPFDLEVLYSALRRAVASGKTSKAATKIESGNWRASR